MKNTKLKKALCILMAVMLLLPALSSLSFAQEAEKEIIHHPYMYTPTVRVSHRDGASYQWYEAIYDEVELTQENVDYIYDNITYSQENGWATQSDYGINRYFNITLDEGQRLVVKSAEKASTDSFDLVDAEETYYSPEELSNGSFIFDIYESKEYALNGNDSVGNIRAFVQTRVDSKKIDGQVSPTLTEYEAGKSYYAVVSYGDGTELESYSFLMDYAILSEPSGYNPSVDVSIKDGASYKWYKLESSDELIEVTDQNAVSVKGSQYGADGWSKSSTYPYVFFEVELKKGDVLIVPNVLADTQAQVYLLDKYRDDYIGAEFGEDGNITVEIDSDGKYQLFIEADDEDPVVKAYIKKAMNEEVKGQVTNTLTEYEIGSKYYVTVSYENGTVLESRVFQTRYLITSHPTMENPTVGTSHDDDVKSYKWYKVDQSGKEYTVAQVFGDEIEAHIYAGEYENGMWKGVEYDSYSYINLFVTARAGDVLKVKLPEDFSGEVRHYGNRVSFEKDENGVYYFEFTSNSTYADFEIIDTKQISGAEITVESYDKTRNVVATKIFDDKNETVYPNAVQTGEYKDGKWKSEDGEIIIFFDIDRENTRLEITPSDTFDGEAAVYTYPGIETVEGDNGIYTLTQKGVYVIVSEDQDSDYELELKIIDGEDEYTVSEKSPYNEELQAFNVSDINDGEYKDGKWYPNGGYHEIDVEFKLERGNILTVIPSENFDGTIVLDVANADDLEIELTEIDGKYIFVADGYYDVDLELENCEADYSAEIKLQKGGFELLEDQTEKELELQQGIFFAEVELEDGTVLASKPFEVLSVVYFETNGGTALESIITTSLTEIEDIQRKGFVFKGWYTEKSFENEVELPLEVTGVITLYAKWEKCDHKASSSQPSCVDSTVCTLCGEDYAPAGHSLQAGYTKAKDSHYYECVACRAKFFEEAHTFTQWQDTKYATRTENGEKARACTACGITESCQTEATGGLSTGATIGIIIGSGAGLFVIAIAVAWFVLKKKTLRA